MRLAVGKAPKTNGMASAGTDVGGTMSAVTEEHCAQE